VHGEGVVRKEESGVKLAFLGGGSSVWICKGDLNKHYDGSRYPIQSFLFCIKATFLVGREKNNSVAISLFSFLTHLQ